MQKCSNLRTGVIHSLSTQFTDLSTAYTQVANTLFYPASTLVYIHYSGVTIYTAIYPHSLDCTPMLVYTIHVYGEQSSIYNVLSLIHCTHINE